MKIILCISVCLFLASPSYCQPGAKVIISNDTNSIEFTPHSILVNGALIESINSIDGKSINTTFFLRDSSFWSFYTNSQNRLSIKGNGEITTIGPLLINNAIYDGKSSLTVNGQARFDSVLFLQASFLPNKNSFISLERNIKGFLEPDDSISAYSTTPTAWAAGTNIPVFRIRHPNSVTGLQNINISAQRDFKIYPYQYGMAIDYNGVVECWVGEWSIHRGLTYYDVEGRGNGWGGVLWVGDDDDLGGIRATARNNESTGGNVKYGELSVEKFAGAPDGDFRFRLPSEQNQFHFVYGPRGSANVVAKISDKGFFIPVVSSAGILQAPEKTQMLFDSTDNQFKGYDGTQWISLQENIKTGTGILSSNGTSSTYAIAHTLQATPSYFNVIATSQDAGNINYVTADTINIIIHYTEPPIAGTNNLSWNWQVKK